MVLPANKPSAHKPLGKAPEEPMPATNHKSLAGGKPMANTANHIKNSWSLIAFAKQFGKPKLATCANHDTGELFKCVAFSKGDTLTFVSFSSKLGELTTRQISQQKDDLQVVLCETKDGKDMYSLCKTGSTWKDIDLGL